MAVNKLAIAGLVCSCIFLPIVPLIGVILSIIALVNINRDKTAGGRGIAIAGIIVGVLMVFIQVILAVIFIGALSFLGPGFAVATMDLKEGMEYCENQEGVQKDICIISLVTANEDATVDICEKLSEEELKISCKAIVTTDESYCEQLESKEDKEACLDAINDKREISSYS